MEYIKFPLVFVVHLSKGAEMREKSIQSQMLKFKFNYEFMLRGDIADISQETYLHYFSGEMLNGITGVVSCALKHIYIYERIVELNLENAIILEDDILLKNNFVEMCTKALTELTHRTDIDKDCYFISLETNGKYVNASEVIKNQVLYKKNTGRFAGAYLISNKVARLILEEIKNTKCDKPIDWFHNQLSEKGVFPIYWIHPIVAEQGSHNGNFDSFLEPRFANHYQKIKWRIESYIKNNLSRRLR